MPDLPAQLTRQSLRYLYRILFLLYAEAHPELGVLPVGDPDYRDGYGLDRLRDLCLVDLTSPQARDGRHLYASLDRAVPLVERGHTPSDGGADSIAVEALRSDLFRPSAHAQPDRRGRAGQRRPAAGAEPAAADRPAGQGGSGASSPTPSSASTSSARSTRA